jgi:hypothetical protein
MHNQPDVGALLSAVADYGTTIVPTDGIAILKRVAGGWRPAAIRAVDDVSDVVCMEQTVELLAAEGWFQHVNRVDDLSQDQRWDQLPLPSSVRTWQSLLIVASEDSGAAYVCRTRRSSESRVKLRRYAPQPGGGVIVYGWAILRPSDGLN